MVSDCQAWSLFRSLLNLPDTNCILKKVKQQPDDHMKLKQKFLTKCSFNWSFFLWKAWVFFIYYWLIDKTLFYKSRKESTIKPQCVFLVYAWNLSCMFCTIQMERSANSLNSFLITLYHQKKAFSSFWQIFSTLILETIKSFFLKLDLSSNSIL